MAFVYLDNAATTPMATSVVNVISDQMAHNFGNASATNYFGRQARKVLDESRHVIAQSINAKDSEIVFTSGGTESDNTAVIETALSRQKLGKHIITTAIEHEAILKPLAYLETLGFEVTYLKPNSRGEVTVQQVKDALRDDTILVTIMYGNNEVGSMNPIKEIGELLKDHQAFFHTDAVQAFGMEDIDVKAEHIDMLSTSAHKINGPKFIGFLYINDKIHIPSFVKGGDQETKRRAGTENVPAIAGFAKAVQLLTPAEKKARQERYFGFKQKIQEILRQNKIEFGINGPTDSHALNHVMNLYLPGIDRGVLLTRLDLEGFAISGGSACTAGSLEPSHVLVAMFGKDSKKINDSVRISFGKDNTEEEIVKFTNKLVDIVRDLTN
ncbi:cysteine desulfurase family protein [Companilactobacillus alimentarius]|uniref:Cysteine desulfurase NifS n=1 Tax=Companilactobacillus alimentarius DSM 20249 TaxID=1423720 RepID=A0A2K9HM26_9LACO|nr:cysteine desulfurase family protein [Companilactobacillus alimentarius]AUI70993.1 cysteine desulfurase NifS [Companilactobacillus alimentarius DSM 20249]KRK75107.1 cysteine desulfurase [Companilactobacillus alimentarius DSM 20249]MDT6951757.1 cysteine desulfurase family protein [Companilactobacillus alimentarius]GEO44119.1 cysteine desulfurase [Companilactobacillus alimentarius]